MCSSAVSPSGSRTRWGGSGGCPDRRPEGRVPDPARGGLPGAGRVPVLVLQVDEQHCCRGQRAGRRWQLRSAAVQGSPGFRTGQRGSPRTCARPDGGSARTPLRRSCASRAWPPAARRRRSTTRPGKGRWRAPDLVKRDFPAQQVNTKWYGDGTEIPTGQGKLYLASVMDMASRRVLGFAPGEHHDAQLAYSALVMAVAVRGGRVPGVIMHTDQGSEPGFKGSPQHCLAGPSIGTHPVPLPGSSSRVSCGGGC